MGAITILIYLLLVVIVIIAWHQTGRIIDMRQKLDRAQAEIRALESKLSEMGDRAEKAEAELEAERKRLDWAMKKQAYYGRSPDRLWVDVGTGNHKWFAVYDDNPRATIDELIAGEKK